MTRSLPASSAHTQRNRVFLAILVTALLFFVFSYINLVLEHSALKEEVAQSAARLHSAKERGLRLEQQWAYVQTEGYKETAAREMLGLARPGDKVFAVMPTDALQGATTYDRAEAGTNVRQLPVWRQWFDLFNLKIPSP